jgi:hypothetical protein
LELFVMTPLHSRHSRHVSLVVRVGAFALVAGTIGLLSVGEGCDIGTSEGEVCNPLVLRDECADGLFCRQFTCSQAFCCPTSGTSTDPNCGGEGCPSGDAGEEAGPEQTDANLAEGG